jgi:hypothetical protein
LVIEKFKAAVSLLVLFCLTGFAQPKPRVDFDDLLQRFPDLPWDFEIRYVVKDQQETDMLRIYFDGRMDLIRWSPEHSGSLALVCHLKLTELEFKQLLQLFRAKKFNELPSENQSVVAVAYTGERIVSVRVGKTLVRKIDRGQLDSPALKQIEDSLEATIADAESKGDCDSESVPAKP